MSAFNLHFREQIILYKNQLILNLLNQRGSEQRLSEEVDLNLIFSFSDLLSSSGYYLKKTKMII